MHTSGNPISIPSHGKDISTLRVEVLPIGCTVAFEDTAPSIVIYTPSTHRVEATVVLLWSQVGGADQ